MNEQEKQAFLDSLNEYPGNNLASLEARIAYQRGWLKGYQTAKLDVLQELADEAKKLEE